MLVPLLGNTWTTLQSQLKNNELIFQYNSKSVTAGFQHVRNKLGIAELRYHDLKQEGGSQLLEQVFLIEVATQVTGHRNLQTLWDTKKSDTSQFFMIKNYLS